MKDHGSRKLAALFLLSAAMALGTPGIAHSQEATLPEPGSSPEAASATIASTTRNVIIIGFVGGFVSVNDTKHPEVQFAAYLRDRYPSIQVEVFGNHHGRRALHHVEHLLDTDHDGTLSLPEKQQAIVILYGQSWGATEAVAFARQLGRMEIPVALTMQIDTIGKPFHKASPISPNVASAINFYQPRGFLHGQPEIVAADPTHTKILGNVRMTYEGRPINCDNYSWYARTFNKPHHEIENDLRLWNELASLINTDLPGVPTNVQTPAPSASPFFQYLRRGIQANEADPPSLQLASEKRTD